VATGLHAAFTMAALLCFVVALVGTASCFSVIDNLGADLVTRGAGASKPKYETINALGRSFSLGYLYDIRRDKIISKSLWDLAELQENIHEESAASTRFVVKTSDDLDDKSDLMDLSASVKASFMSGMVDVAGSAKFMKSKKSSFRVTSVTFKSERKTRTLRLSMDQLAHLTHPEVLAEEEATHVIAGITYGANAFFKFEKTLDDDDDKQEIGGSLYISVNSMPNLAVSGNGSIELDSGTRDFVNDLRVEFYGDYDVSPPTSFDAAVSTVQNLKMDGEVPITVSLVPLHTLSDKADIMVRKLNAQTVDDMGKVIMYLDQTEEKLNEVIKLGVSKTFPEYSRFIGNVKLKFKQKGLDVREKLADILPKIRAAEAQLSDLNGLISDFESSMFSQQHLNPWLMQQNEELMLFNIVQEQLKLEGGSAGMAVGGKIDDVHTYEALLGHMLQAPAGLYVLNVCLVSSAHPDLLKILDVSAGNKQGTYPVNENYWAGMDEGEFQGQFFEFVDSLRRFAISNADQTDLRFITYSRYMCPNNEVSIDYYKLGRRLFSNVDIGIELSNVKINLSAQDISYQINRNFNEEHEVTVEIQYTDMKTGVSKVAQGQLPKMEPGKYKIKVRAVAVGNGHTDWEQVSKHGIVVTDAGKWTTAFLA